MAKEEKLMAEWYEEYRTASEGIMEFDKYSFVDGSSFAGPDCVELRHYVDYGDDEHCWAGRYAMDRKEYIAAINRLEKESSCEIEVKASGSKVQLKARFIEINNDGSIRIKDANHSLLEILEPNISLDSLIIESDRGLHIDDFIRKLLLDLGFSEDHVLPWVGKNIDAIKLTPSRFSIERGYTGLGVVINKEWALKFDKMPRIGREFDIYTKCDFDNYAPFVPKVKGFSTTDDEQYGALILENLFSREKSGQQLVSEIAAQRGVLIKTEIDFNLFLMGLFHAGSQGNYELAKNLEPVIYEDIRGIPHHLAGNIPLKGIAKRSYERFMETAIDTSQIVSIIETYNMKLKTDHLSKKLTVIHGDWKPENMANGYPVDFAMVGLAHEVDELAYYLSDHRLRIDLNKFHKSVDKYIEFRCKHDKGFHIEIQEGRRQAMHELADSAFLRQLVLRHSVMKKRDLMDDEKYEQRLYYKQRIEEIMAEGGFV